MPRGGAAASRAGGRRLTRALSWDSRWETGTCALGSVGPIFGFTANEDESCRADVVSECSCPSELMSKLLSFAKEIVRFDVSASPAGGHDGFMTTSKQREHKFKCIYELVVGCFVGDSHAVKFLCLASTRKQYRAYKLTGAKTCFETC